MQNFPPHPQKIVYFEYGRNKNTSIVLKNVAHTSP